MHTVTALEVYTYYDNLFPASLSCEWDSDGLMCCPDPNRAAQAVLFALDAMPETIRYAAEHHFDVIVTHHPLLFRPIKTLTSPKLIQLIQSGISVFSFHTRLDAVEGGVNDRLASMLGLTDTEPFAENCGRIGTLPQSYSIDEFSARVCNILGCDGVSAINGGGTVRRLAVVSGAGGDFVKEAAVCGADTFLSGEIGYHHMLDAAEYGMNAVEAGHDWSELHILDYLEQLCQAKFNTIRTEQYRYQLIKRRV